MLEPHRVRRQRSGGGIATFWAALAAPDDAYDAEEEPSDSETHERMNDDDKPCRFQAVVEERVHALGVRMRAVELQTQALEDSHDKTMHRYYK